MPAHAARIVIPSVEQKLLRCRCGHMDFGGHVQPLARGGAVLKELVCRQCQFVLEVRPDTMALERSGYTIDMKGEPIS